MVECPNPFSQFVHSPFADFNRTGGASVQEILDFLSAWFAGC